jgi:hypothetical protein
MLQHDSPPLQTSTAANADAAAAKVSWSPFQFSLRSLAILVALAALLFGFLADQWLARVVIAFSGVFAVWALRRLSTHPPRFLDLRCPYCSQIVRVEEGFDDAIVYCPECEAEFDYPNNDKVGHDFERTGESRPDGAS